MNKKILTICTLIALSLPAVAQGPLQLPHRWQDALKQKIDCITFNNSMKTLEKSLLLTIPVTKQYFPKFDVGASLSFEETDSYRKLTSFEEVKTYPSTAGCKAYALDEHWIMAGGTCLWNGRHTTDFTPSSSTYIFATGLVEPNADKQNLKIGDTAISWKENLFIQPRNFKAPHVILVRVPESTALSRRLQNWPKINILAFKDSTPADLTEGEFYINSARFGLNGTHKRTLASNQPSSSVVILQDTKGKISGVSTDPLAYVKHGQLRWVGVNQGITELRYGNLAGDWDGKPSNEYFYFNEEDAAFIKNTISKHDPAAWKRIEARKGLEIL